MLQILGVFSHIEVSITSGLYAVVARVYDILLELIQDTSDLTGASETFQSLLTTCYVLAGVFMLFRTAIGMIQMIINPDQVSDAKVGAGKLMTRIVISIILLLVLVPNGILFDNKKGLFPRIEHALISADDGLIINLINENVEGPSPYIEGMVFQAKSDIDRGITSNFFVEDVYAADVYKCYYYQISEKAIGSTGKQRASIKKYYRLSFSKSKKNNGKTYTKIKNSDDWYFYSLTSDSEVGKGAIKDKDGDPLRYTKWSKVKVLNKKESNRKGDEKSKYAKDSSFATCPPGILQSGEVLSVSPKFDAKISVNYTKDFTPNGLYGGTTNLKDLVDHANNFMKGRDQDDALVYDTNAEDIETPSKSYLDHISPTAKVFAQGTASSFQDCAQGSEEKCESVQSKMFLSSNANDKLEDLIDSGDLQLGFIISMIAGIGLIVYLLVLCVDIIVRRFKLMLLQVMAPIPAISYVDPNDKIFPQWLKMYVSTYLDLFIKLIAIALAVGILNGVLEGDTWKNGNLLYRFFYIVAILVFAKLVPSMISKIFGLDSLGGSFKDILGMGKAAAGFGAGAALGLGAGLVTGASAFAATKGQGKLNRFLAGASALGSGLSGAAAGAGAGSKGNITGGAKTVAGQNANRRNLYAGGVTAANMLEAATLGRFGLDKASRVDKKQQSEAERVKAIKKGDDFMKAMKQGAKDTKFYKSLRDYASDPNNNFRLNDKQWGDVEDAIATAHLMGNKDEANAFLRNELQNQGISDAAQAAWGSNDYYDSKQAGIIGSNAELYDTFLQGESVGDVINNIDPSNRDDLEAIARANNGDKTQRFKKYKAIDKAIQTDARETSTKQQREQMDGHYVGVAAAKGDNNSNKSGS